VAELEEEGVGERPGRRCEIGCETWPDNDAYEICPRCGEPTKRYVNLHPMDEAEAYITAAHLDFEDYYQHEWPEERAAWLRDNPQHDWRDDVASTSDA
jgi:hypothetical protein